MRKDNTIEAFFALVRTGLWSDGNQEIRIDGTTDWAEVYQLAQDQSVQGLVLAGIEHFDVKPPKELLLQWIGEVQMVEQRNKAMNGFVAKLIETLRKEDVYAILVKGQGIAQCYERPLLRACGDVDLFLSEDNYKKATMILTPLASTIEKENLYEKHIGMVIDSWMVELHGNLHAGISSRMDKGIDGAQKDVFYGGQVRSWLNDRTQVFLPGVDEDVIFIFTHILKHFFKGGIGLRQVCDLCRLLQSYKEKINVNLLKERLRRMGIMSEWKAFATLAVNYLGLNAKVMPLYSNEKRWDKKAERILDIMFETGNMGHNIDYSYQKEYTPVKRKLVTWGIMVKDSFRRFFVFPLNTMRSLVMFTRMGVVSFFGNK